MNKKLVSLVLTGAIIIYGASQVKVYAEGFIDKKTSVEIKENVIDNSNEGSKKEDTYKEQKNISNDMLELSGSNHDQNHNQRHIDNDGDGICDNTGEPVGSNHVQNHNQGQGHRQGHR